MIHAGWVRSLFDGRGSFTLTVHGGYNYATSRPDGNSAIWGATANFDWTFTDLLQHRPDPLPSGLHRRDLHPPPQGQPLRVRGGLVWEFVKTWSLRPEILYIRDQSNAVGFNYSSTEVWINVRKAF